MYERSERCKTFENNKRVNSLKRFSFPETTLEAFSSLILKEKHDKGRVQIRSTQVLLVSAQFERRLLLLSGENIPEITERSLLLIVSWLFSFFVVCVLFFFIWSHSFLF